ncbi:glycosyl hydrolase family 8 [Microbulbifer sp. GL-2]|uniref:glycosyl hydrolase family 8 n=1 Tax=Microbulbifer sp. GL-2 TaxID=2591606 RepID=UPI001164826F|nr:glycosyl hydrolase family 8 [Microbulbifer sp. GL-2]BBM04015.1 hypothetical protein GL2_40890 [Microbulbifer sp. GL-2]
MNKLMDRFDMEFFLSQSKTASQNNLKTITLNIRPRKKSMANFKSMRSLFCVVIMALSASFVTAQNYPFPQNIDYYGIKPNSQTTQSQNESVKEFYDYWKDKYLRQSATIEGGYYVHGADTDGHGKGTSESHGYGMVITALMAGYNQNAKSEFDGLFTFFNTHRSHLNAELMGWKIDESETSGIYSSATDGDMDIAYALLLADKQWGSNTEINYKQEAIDMINNGLRVSDYNSESKRLMLGDWDTQKIYTTRSSDWMTGHLRAYENATNDAEWLAAIDSIYDMVAQLNTQNSNSGLMPDFVTGQNPRPDTENDNGTGEKNSGHYYYNAARTPLRLSMDYIHNGDQRSKSASEKLVTWVRLQIGDSYDFNKYYSGYTINGNVLPGAEYNSTVFIAPVVVAASVDSANQEMVNAGWNYIKAKHESYFEDTINLLSLLALTGNWWAPNQTTGNDNGIPIALSKSATTTMNMPVLIRLEGIDDGTITAYHIHTQPAHGAISWSGSQVNYVPSKNYIGSDSFSYTVTDDDGNVSVPAKVTLSVIEDTLPTLSCNVKEEFWTGGFLATVTVTNTSEAVLRNWQVDLSLGVGESFNYGWSANFNASSNPLKASGLEWNNLLQPGESTDFGFIGDSIAGHSKITCQ